MKIHVGKSKLEGTGLFASKDIKKGETVFVIKGERKKFLIHNKNKADMAGMNWVGLGKNEWIDPSRYCQYFNHSCDPNTKIKGKVTVVAIKNIKKGEEITFDYSLNEADVFWKLDMDCMCDTKKCRKKIRSIQFLPEKEFKKKMHLVPKSFQKIFRRFKLAKFKDEKELVKKWVDFIKKDFNV